MEAWQPTDFVSSLLRGELPAFYAGVDGMMSRDVPGSASEGAKTALPALALLPGAFNPVHEGHWKLTDVASRLLGCPVAFELSVVNVDKPGLPATEIRRRLQQFTWRMPVWVTNAPTFTKKAALFPGAVFVVGADTAERILAPRYYGDSETRMAEAMESIRQQACRFLVAGRRVDSKDTTEGARAGKYAGLDDLGVPEAYRDLFSGIAKKDFDVPISSTAVRAGAAKGEVARPD
jgi:nicotinic acid mononucleotide adenylyltransferase